MSQKGHQAIIFASLPAYISMQGLGSLSYNMH